MQAVTKRPFIIDTWANQLNLAAVLTCGLARLVGCHFSHSPKSLIFWRIRPLQVAGATTAYNIARTVYMRYFRCSAYSASIRYDQLGRRPEQRLDEMLPQDVVLPPVREILAEFDRWVPNQPYHGQTFNALRDALIMVHGKVAYAQDIRHSDTRKFLQHLMIRLRDPSIEGDKKRDCLRELCFKYMVCVPTWYEETRRAYMRLSKLNESPEDTLLRLVERVKEELILDGAQRLKGVHWNALNYVRHHVGKEIGLDPTLAAGDNYATQPIKWPFTKGFCKSWFYDLYTVDALVNGIQAALAMADYDQVAHVHRYLFENEGNLELHYGDDDKINGEGVLLLLRHLKLVA